MRLSVPAEHMTFPQNYIRQVHAPDIVNAAMAYSDQTYRASRLSLREFEAARARTAWINGCSFCQKFRTGTHLEASLARRGSSTDISTTVAARGPAPDEAFYAAVSDWRNATCYSERERIALEYADGLGTDPQGIARDEAFWLRAKAAYSDAEVVDLSYCIACWIGIGRITHALGMDDVCSLPGAGDS